VSRFLTADELVDTPAAAAPTVTRRPRPGSSVQATLSTGPDVVSRP